MGAFVYWLGFAWHWQQNNIVPFENATSINLINPLCVLSFCPFCSDAYMYVNYVRILRFISSPCRPAIVTGMWSSTSWPYTVLLQLQLSQTRTIRQNITTSWLSRLLSSSTERNERVGQTVGLRSAYTLPVGVFIWSQKGIEDELQSPTTDMPSRNSKRRQSAHDRT